MKERKKKKKKRKKQKISIRRRAKESTEILPPHSLSLTSSTHNTQKTRPHTGNKHLRTPTPSSLLLVLVARACIVHNPDEIWKGSHQHEGHGAVESEFCNVPPKHGGREGLVYDDADLARGEVEDG